MTGTRTYVVMELSKEAYREIREKMWEADYLHAIGKNRKYGEVIDMHGIAVAEEREANERAKQGSD